jgi:putative transposase
VYEEKPGFSRWTVMAIPIRHSNPVNMVAAGRTFFVTSTTWGRHRVLQSTRSAELFVRTLYEYRAQGKYRLHEFVVMPDHFHLLITVGSQITIERAVQFIKGGFAFRAGREYGMKSPIWQKGFSEIRVNDSLAFARQREYIRNNPVLAFLASRAEDYSGSSAFPGSVLDPPPQRLKPLVAG